jgi:hypothetical protein
MALQPNSIPALVALDLRDEYGDGSADRLGMILLKKMNAIPQLDEPAILELAGEFLRIPGRNECARLGGKEEFWIGRGGERFVRALHRRINVGGLARDWQSVREAPGRLPRLRRREWRAIDRHLVVGELAPDGSLHQLNEGVAFEDQFLPFPGRAELAEDLARLRASQKLFPSRIGRMNSMKTRPRTKSERRSAR